MGRAHGRGQTGGMVWAHACAGIGWAARRLGLGSLDTRLYEIGLVDFWLLGLDTLLSYSAAGLETGLGLHTWLRYPDTRLAYSTRI